MSYSLNEIDTLCRKAARGTGLDWGHAEDAGKAARWLQARDLPGAECLLTCLEAGDAARPIEVQGAEWRADGPLCPIVAGASLCDHAELLADQAVTLHDVRAPLLLAPFAAAAAARMGRAIRLAWQDAALTFGPAARFDGSRTALRAPAAGRVTWGPAEDAASDEGPRTSRAHLPRDIYDRLDALARRTYAPATEESRAAGAGAGLTDND